MKEDAPIDVLIAELRSLRYRAELVVAEAASELHQLRRSMAEREEVRLSTRELLRER